MNFTKQEKSHSNKFYRQLYSVWHHMMVRCYNEKSKDYHSYGGEGVFVATKWRTFDGFADDADKLYGWNKTKFIEHSLQLDKDFICEEKSINPHYYSKNTCKWVLQGVNKGYRPNLMPPMIILDRHGNEFIRYNKLQVQKEFDISSDTLHRLLNGTTPYSKAEHLQIRYVRDKSKLRSPDEIDNAIILMNPKGLIEKYTSKLDVYKKYPELKKGYILSTALKNNHEVLGFQVWYQKDYIDGIFKKPSSLRTYKIKKTKQIKGYQYAILFNNNKTIDYKDIKDLNKYLKSKSIKRKYFVKCVSYALSHGKNEFVSKGIKYNIIV